MCILSSKDTLNDSDQARLKTQVYKMKMIKGLNDIMSMIVII